MVASQSTRPSARNGTLTFVQCAECNDPIDEGHPEALTLNGERAHAECVVDSCAQDKRDGCVVETAPLARAVTDFCKRWNVSRGPSAGEFGTSPEQSSVGPVDYLADRTRIPKSTIQELTSKRCASETGRSRRTELRIADALVTAIGRPEMLHDGTLTIEGNRLAPKSLRAACCPGSRR